MILFVLLTTATIIGFLGGIVFVLLMAIVLGGASIGSFTPKPAPTDA